jgi:hypothetical protein
MPPILNSGCRPFRNRADALTVAPGPSQTYSDYADQYMSVTAGTGEP